MLRRRKKRFPFKIILSILACIFIITGFVIGYCNTTIQRKEGKPLADQYGLQVQERADESRKDLALKKENELTLEDNQDRAVTHHEDTIVETTNIIYKRFYKICQDTVQESLKPDNLMIGLNEKGFKGYLERENLSFEIQSFSAAEVVLIEKVDSVCSAHYNHYIISESGELIAIYHIDAEGKKSLIEKTSIPISVLPHIDQKKLKNGILRKEKEEVYQLLEDYSS